jgi:hypothetical protein
MVLADGRKQEGDRNRCRQKASVEGGCPWVASAICREGKQWLVVGACKKPVGVLRVPTMAVVYWVLTAMEKMWWGCGWPE